MKTRKLALLFLAIAFLISLQQQITWGKWFEITDIHHELFIVTFGFAGIMLLILKRKGKGEVTVL